MPDLKLGEISYFWREAGTGPVPAHFIHCSLASSRAWGATMAEFSNDLTISAIDLPGHGRTDMPLEDVDIQQQALQASIAVIERGDKPVHLLGHSFGGAVALRIALERPDLVLSLAMVEPIIFAVLDDAGHPAFDDVKRTEGPIQALLDKGENRAAAKLFLDRWGTGGEWDSMSEERKQIMISRIWFVTRSRASVMERNDARMHLQDMYGVKAPTLLMRGGISPESIKNVNDTLCAALPNARQVVIQGAGHMLPLTHSAEFFALLREFWQP